MVCCLICGCEENSKKINTPSEYPNPPQKILCPNCGESTRTVYKRSYGRFWLCFIPCCCTGSDSEPYLACINCNQPLNLVSTNTCKNCGLATTFRSNNCPSCGKEKERL